MDMGQALTHGAWAGDPLEALARWPRDRGVTLLHAGRFHPRWARRSILAQPAGRFVFRASGESAWEGEPAEGLEKIAWTHQPWADLRMLLEATRGRGMWVGYFGYDLARWVEHLPLLARADRDWPVVELAWCPGWAEFDLETGQWSGRGTWAGGLPELQKRDACSPQAPSPCPLSESEGKATHAGAAGGPAGSFELHEEPRSGFTRAGYEAAVERAINYIGAGDVFQVNLSQRFTAQGRGDPRAIYRKLATVSPAWYGAYLELGERGERIVASTSPELFLEMGRDRNIITRPIKGTRPARVPPEVLRDSLKDTAELHMIVDLMRNDLGRVCAYGSVNVEQAREIETHPTVHHGVATVTGRLHEDRDVVDLLRATLPGGSVTGAPKKRAMEIIEELEPVRRNVYCGAIGWLTAEALCLNVAIRTLMIEREESDQLRIDYSVGGGVVADSDPAAEYQETLDKAEAMRRTLETRG